MASLNAVADYILYVAHDAGEPITNLKLQKLVYYAQAWSLALRGEPMFPEKIKAWVHGPVVPQLYHRFKDSGSQPIAFSPDALENSLLDEDERALLDEVLEVYLGFSTWDLERMTHAEDPWREARGDLADDEPSEAEISQDTMAKYYAERAGAAAEEEAGV